MHRLSQCTAHPKGSLVLTEQYIPGQFEAMLETERARLVRLCGLLTGNGDAAEDLTQETLIEAWRHRHKLTDWQGATAWLSAIARNVCLRWRRRQGRELARKTGPAAAGEPNAIDALPDPFDVEWALEREELATLLDQALALLPPETRSALVEHYLEARPIAQVAARQGLREGTVAVRLHRGKLALRRVLATELRDDAMSYGITMPHHDGWQATRKWCPLCGQERLLSRLGDDGKSFEIKCTHCYLQPGGMDIRWHQTTLFADVKSYWVAYRRLCDWSYTTFRDAIKQGFAPCHRCRVPVSVRTGVPAEAPIQHQGIRAVHLRCPSCNCSTYSSLNGLVIHHPAVRAFWSEHPRMRVIPAREVEADGRATLITGCESLDGSTSLNLIVARDTLQIVGVHGAAHAKRS